jgi:hypothetical protein
VHGATVDRDMSIPVSGDGEESGARIGEEFQCGGVVKLW